DWCAGPRPASGPSLAVFLPLAPALRALVPLPLPPMLSARGRRSAARLLRSGARRRWRARAERGIALSELRGGNGVDPPRQVRQPGDLARRQRGVELVQVPVRGDRDEVLGPGDRADLGNSRRLERAAHAE